MERSAANPSDDDVCCMTLARRRCQRRSTPRLRSGWPAATQACALARVLIRRRLDAGGRADDPFNGHVVTVAPGPKPSRLTKAARARRSRAPPRLASRRTGTLQDHLHRHGGWGTRAATSPSRGVVAGRASPVRDHVDLRGAVAMPAGSNTFARWACAMRKTTTA